MLLMPASSSGSSMKGALLLWQKLLGSRVPACHVQRWWRRRGHEQPSRLLLLLGTLRLRLVVVLLVNERRGRVRRRMPR